MRWHGCVLGGMVQCLLHIDSGASVANSDKSSDVRHGVVGDRPVATVSACLCGVRRTGRARGVPRRFTDEL